MTPDQVRAGQEIYINGNWRKVLSVEQDKPHNLWWFWVGGGRYVRVHNGERMEVR